MSISGSEGGWPEIVVVGAGAVGCYFGGMLARAGAPVTLIGRQSHVDAIARNGLFLEGLHVNERVPVRATTEIGAVRPAQLVLFCVKTVDTETVARTLVPHLAPNSTVISLQNGVDNVERIHPATGIEALAAVVYVAAAMIAPGHVRHSGRGDLIVGSAARPSEADLEAIAGTFVRAGIPCRVSQDIKKDLWTKMLMNCAYNAISALGRSRYGRMVSSPLARDLMKEVVAETVRVARAEGVSLSETAMLDATFELGHAMAGALSSTAQDINRGRPTEIDSLNGYVVRQGARLGVPAPVNQALYALVKLLEESPSEEQAR